MTSAEVIAMVIETHKDSIGTHYSECWKYHAGCLAVKLRDMLREPGEPEWEYVGMAFEHGGFMRIRNDQLVPEKFDSWRKLMAQYPRVEILKRVKAVPAGPWLPVEGESDER